MVNKTNLDNAIKKLLSDPFKEINMAEDKKTQGPADGGASPIADERVDNVKTVVAGRQLSTYEDTTQRTSPSPVYVKGEATHESELPAGDDQAAQERAAQGANVGGPDAETSADGLDNLAKDEDDAGKTGTRSSQK